MIEGLRLDLVAYVRRLVEVDAVTNPDLAAARLDHLVSQHGREQVAAALLEVAPDELAEIVRTPHHLPMR